MTEAVLAAGITGLFTFAGTVITVLATARKTGHQLQISQAVTDEKITELTREVREHNHFAQRMPVVEEQLKVIRHRMTDAETEIKNLKEKEK